MHAHAHEVAGARGLVEGHEPVGVKLLRFPERDDVLVAKLGRVAVGFYVIVILSTFSALLIHLPCIPVADHRHALGTPVRPDTELGIAKPLRALVVDE